MPISPNDSIDFMKIFDLGLTKKLKSVVILLRIYIGNLNHFWLWDIKSIKSELIKASFNAIRQAQLGDSRNLRFNENEDKS